MNNNIKVHYSHTKNVHTFIVQRVDEIMSYYELRKPVFLQYLV